MRFNWGTGIFIFFTIFLALAFTFIVFSFRQNNDLVTDDYYEQGADYSTQLKINKRSQLFADSLKIGTDNSNVLMISSAYLVENADSLMAHFYYPAAQEKDMKLLFTSISDTLSVSKAELGHGRYIVKLNWVMNSEKYYLEKVIFID